VHDITNLEAAGLAGVFIASTEFIAAALAQSRALGSDPARLFVPHPIQDRSDAEMRALADAAIDDVIALLVG
jgi:hypothetical protein